MLDDIISSAKRNSHSLFGNMEETKKDIDENAKIRISVVGVGGAGCNCINRLSKLGIRSAQTIAINTDMKHLKIVNAEKKVLIGREITRGLGAGGDMDLARKVAETDRRIIEEAIGENELIFLVAGMGGGTGSGAAPVVAEVAKEQGAIVIAFVTYPFALERVRIKKAQRAIQELIPKCDTVVVIDNNRLINYVPNLQIDKAFSLVDMITGRAVMAISDTIMYPSLINVDYADVKTVMNNGGLAMISIGEGAGMNKVEDAVKNTIEHPLLDVDYEGAKGALIHIEGGPDLTLGEAIEAGNKLTESFDENASIKVGARINPDLERKMRIHAIVTGVKSPSIFGKKEEDEGIGGGPEEEGLYFI